MKGKTALFLGRFQPFHLGHLWVVRNLAGKYGRVIIIVGTRQQKGEKNPFSYAERRSMIAAVLRKLKLKNCTVKGIADHPSDDTWMRKLKGLVPKNSVMFTGNKEMLRLFREYHFPVHKVRIYRGISATKVRKLIRDRKGWQYYVDEIIAEFLKKKRLLQKVKGS